MCKHDTKVAVACCSAEREKKNQHNLAPLFHFFQGRSSLGWRQFRFYWDPHHWRGETHCSGVSACLRGRKTQLAEVKILCNRFLHVERKSARAHKSHREQNVHHAEWNKFVEVTAECVRVKFTTHPPPHPPPHTPSVSVSALKVSYLHLRI